MQNLKIPALFTTNAFWLALAGAILTYIGVRTNAIDPHQAYAQAIAILAALKIGAGMESQARATNGVAVATTQAGGQ